MFGQHNVSRNECGRESKQIIRLLSMNQLCNKKKTKKQNITTTFLFFLDITLIVETDVWILFLKLLWNFRGCEYLHLFTMILCSQSLSVYLAALFSTSCAKKNAGKADWCSFNQSGIPEYHQIFFFWKIECR